MQRPLTRLVTCRSNISTSTLSKQLPTFILFRNGVEVRRRPRVVDGVYYACRFNQVSRHSGWDGLDEYLVENSP